MLSAIGIILTLVIMEGLLSTDNALVLGNMVRVLPNKTDQKKALLYGLWGAVGFRAICIGAWSFIAGYDWLLWGVQILGALYLGKMALGHFIGSDTADDDNNGISDAYEEKWLNRLLGKFGIKLSQFVQVIIAVELMDIAFSTDSILAAFALSTNFWILLLGGFLGILMMRGVAQLFIKLLEAIPEFEGTSYVLIGLIALRMLLENIHHVLGLFKVTMNPIVIGDIWFFGALVVTFLGTFVVHQMKKSKTTVEVE